MQIKMATSRKNIPHAIPMNSPEGVPLHRADSSYLVGKSLLIPCMPEPPILPYWCTGCSATHRLASTANLVQNRDQQGSH